MITNKEKNFISVVLYVHNNDKQLQSFLSKLYNILDSNFENFEVICANDYSTDESVQAIRSFASNIKNTVFSLVNMSIYQGIELSMIAGVDLAIGDFVYEFDNLDDDYPINLIMDVYYQSLKGYDIVSATPENIPRKSSQLFYNIFNNYSKNQDKLRTESFRILSRRAINRVHSIGKTIPYRKALYANSGLKVDVILYKQSKKEMFKESKQVRKTRRNLAIDSLILFTDVAYKISLYLTLIMVLLTILVGGYTLIVYFSQNKPLEGWTTIMLFLAMSFFGVFLVLAIVIKYLSIIMDLVFKKQKYLIESIEKLQSR